MVLATVSNIQTLRNELKAFEPPWKYICMNLGIRFRFLNNVWNDDGFILKSTKDKVVDVNFFSIFMTLTLKLEQNITQWCHVIYMLIYVDNFKCLPSHVPWYVCKCMLMMYILNYNNDVMWLLSYDDMMYMLINGNDVIWL